MTSSTTLTALATLDTLREFADLEFFFDQLRDTPAAEVASMALFDPEGGDLERQFGFAVLRELLGVELFEDEELSELSLVELLDPAKGYPTLETRAYAALLALSLPAPAEDRRNYAYFASYALRHEPGLGLAVSLNELRERHGLSPTGW